MSTVKHLPSLGSTKPQNMTVIKIAGAEVISYRNQFIFKYHFTSTTVGVKIEVAEVMLLFVANAFICAVTPGWSLKSQNNIFLTPDNTFPQPKVAQTHEQTTFIHIA